MDCGLEDEKLRMVRVAICKESAGRVGECDEDRAQKG